MFVCRIYHISYIMSTLFCSTTTDFIDYHLWIELFYYLCLYCFIFVKRFQTKLFDHLSFVDSAFVRILLSLCIVWIVIHWSALKAFGEFYWFCLWSIRNNNSINWFP